jgi:hypothetical protein
VIAVLMSAILQLVFANLAVGYSLGNAKWCPNPVGDRANNAYYKLQWNLGTDTAPAKAVSLGRDQWNRQNRELNYAWNQGVVPWLEVRYGLLGWPNDGYLAVHFPQSYQVVSGSTCLRTSDIVFNSKPSWWTGNEGTFWFWADESTDFTPAGKYDARSLASHEFGHAVMLNHVNGSGTWFERDSAVMYCCFASGQSRWVLRTDDINGLKAWYPPK